MNEARALISAFHSLNETSDRQVAQFTPSLIGLFGSTRMFEAFLSSIDDALVSRKISESVKARAEKLTNNFIPQVAKLNGITELSSQADLVEQLGKIRTDSAENLQEGVRAILTSLIKILDAVCRIG